MIKKYHYKLFIELGFFSIIFLTGIYFLFTSGFLEIEKFNEFVNLNPAFSFVIYFFLFVIFALLGVSVTPMLILAGIIFGIYYGFLIGFIALYVSSMGAFFITKIISHKLIEKHHPNYEFKFMIVNNIVKKMNKSLGKNQFKVIFVLKFIVSNVVVSYALGLISEKVNFKQFVFATLANNFLYTALMIFIGEEFIRNPIYMSVILVIIFSYYSGRYIMKRYHLGYRIKG